MSTVMSLYLCWKHHDAVEVEVFYISWESKDPCSLLATLMLYCGETFLQQLVNFSCSISVLCPFLSFSFSHFLLSLSADEYKVFLVEREEKLKADAEAAAVAAAEASTKKKWRLSIYADFIHMYHIRTKCSVNCCVCQIWINCPFNNQCVRLCVQSDYFCSRIFKQLQITNYNSVLVFLVSNIYKLGSPVIHENATSAEIAPSCSILFYLLIHTVVYLCGFDWCVEKFTFCNNFIGKFKNVEIKHASLTNSNIWQMNQWWISSVATQKGLKLICCNIKIILSVDPLDFLGGFFLFVCLCSSNCWTKRRKDGVFGMFVHTSCSSDRLCEVNFRGHNFLKQNRPYSPYNDCPTEIVRSSMTSNYSYCIINICPASMMTCIDIRSYWF